MNENLVSVIVPVFNVEKYLEQCLNSIIAQTYKNIEIILIDDGSSDKSPEICDAFANRDNRIKVIHQINSGVSAARNNGLEVSSGEYIFLVDSDDYIDETMISKMMSTINEDVDLVVAGIANFEKNNVINSVWTEHNGVIEIQDYLPIMIKLHTNPFIGGPVSKIFRKRILETGNIKFEVGENFAEDFVFNMKYLLETKNKVSIIEEPLYFRRADNVNSLSKVKHEQEKLWERKKIVYEYWKNTCLYLDTDCNNYQFLLLKFLIKTISQMKLSGEYTNNQIIEICKDEFVLNLDCSNLSFSMKFFHKLLINKNFTLIFLILFIMNKIVYPLFSSRLFNALRYKK